MKLNLDGKLNFQEATTLYDNENGTTGSIILNETCENFNRIIIFTRFISSGSPYYTSTIVDNPNNKEVAISTVVGVSGGGNHLMGTVLKRFNGTDVTSRRNYTYTGSQKEAAATDEMWVYKIIGLDRRI